jgi:hypothetical protein
VGSLVFFYIVRLPNSLARHPKVGQPDGSSSKVEHNNLPWDNLGLILAVVGLLGSGFWTNNLLFGEDESDKYDKGRGLRGNWKVSAIH